MLVVAIVLEGFSLRTARKEADAMRRPGESYWRFIRTPGAGDPGGAARGHRGAAGLVFALLGVGLSVLTGSEVFDALGTVAIGLLLVAVAAILGVETKSLLLGESATPEVQRRIAAALEDGGAGPSVIHMRTQHLGPEELLVAAKIAVAARRDGGEHRPRDRRGRGADPGRRADRPGDLPRAGPAPARGGARSRAPVPSRGRERNHAGLPSPGDDLVVGRAPSCG